MMLYLIKMTYQNEVLHQITNFQIALVEGIIPNIGAKLFKHLGAVWYHVDSVDE